VVLVLGALHQDAAVFQLEGQPAHHERPLDSLEDAALNGGQVFREFPAGAIELRDPPRGVGGSRLSMGWWPQGAWRLEWMP
jgi:hypothetical protein